MTRVFVPVQVHEINLAPSEEKSISKLLHRFSLDLKKWALVMEWSNNELAYNTNGDNTFEVCFAKSSWNEHAILEKACAGAQSRLMFAILKLFAQIQQAIPLEKFAYIWYVYICYPEKNMQTNQHRCPHASLSIFAGLNHQQ